MLSWDVRIIRGRPMPSPDYDSGWAGMTSMTRLVTGPGWVYKSAPRASLPQQKMPGTTSITLDKATFKGTVTVPTGLFIGGQWVDPVEPDTIDITNPSTGETIAKVSLGSKKDVDIAVKAAHKAYKSSWGLKVPGYQRGKLLLRLADLIERDADQLAALETVNVGKPFPVAKAADVMGSVRCIRYFGGWADKIEGKVIETDENKFAYTRHEPFGVVGQIIPWNFPLLMLSWKVGPALATGNCIVLKPSEMTPLSALKFAELCVEAGFPPGVVNIVNGYGITVGAAIAEHMDIHKVAFTGSTLVGRKVLEAAARTNLKVVTLELGGKSPSIVFDDCDFEQTVKWVTQAMYANMGILSASTTYLFRSRSPQASRVSPAPVSSFRRASTTSSSLPIARPSRHWETPPATRSTTLRSMGLRHVPTVPHRRRSLTPPQVSQTQFDRIMGFIDSGKADGATVHLGGERHGSEGFFIQPTIFTDVKPEMTIAKEEIFGPVTTIMKFTTEEDVIAQANDTVYGLASYVYSDNVKRALRVAHALEAGSAFVNTGQTTDPAIPFGGYKQSGIGREHGEYALDTYTQVKGIHVNLGVTL
ncbi:Aldehyde dehydrogenase [Mycena indigotica]|uniref:Aldehyde dehydrogenase n=1 Tax=Mycena indigotica TaxID=2126181 RepID=A0A8H6SQ80_9AGAR|nr:Aldehyde dehydrogenase [Mycena indigotica]KAF7303516.1 Aldehyde dehydrogenase [Mycena indigotica]